MIAAAVVQEIIMGLTFPSRQSIIPEIVGEEQLMNAISLNMIGMNILRLFTPAITGFLIDAIGFAAMYYVDEAYRERVISFSKMEYGLSSLGTFRAGLIAEAIGVQWAIGGFALGPALVSAVMLAFVPRMRKLD